ncbi:MAG: OadG-related small transporter subunit [Oscillospiraceae bacterium]|jgi:Na+-transporting methylmalonyl-CoA/oxaloacetate decarboxylase gamma subunit
MTDLQLGFQLMGYGLLGVFSVLFLFIVMILGLTKVFPPKD